MNLIIASVMRSTVIVFIICCCSSMALADYIKSTAECAQWQQLLKGLDAGVKYFEQIESKAYTAVRNVDGAVTQVDYTKFDALTKYIAIKEQTYRALQQDNTQTVNARSQYYQLKDRFNDVCYVRVGPPPPPPAPPAPPPPPMTPSVRIENIGDHRILFSVVSRSNGVIRVCDVDAVDSNAAMEPSIGRCSGAPIEMALHNGHQLVYYKLDVGTIYQIYWSGQEWRLRFANRQ